MSNNIFEDVVNEIPVKESEPTLQGTVFTESDIEDIPTKAEVLNTEFNKTLEVDPDKAARVYNLAKKTNTPVPIIENNLQEYELKDKYSNIDFDTMFKQNPLLFNYLEDPEKMTLAKDDVDTLKDIEDTGKSASWGSLAWSSFLAGGAQIGSTLAKTPSAIYNTAALPQNFFYKTIGKPEYQVSAPMDNALSEYYDKNLEGLYSKVPELNKSIVGEIGEGNITDAGKTLLSQFIVNAPNQALLIMGYFSGIPIATLAGMGAMAGTQAMDSALDSGADPTSATLDAILQGSIEASFESLGTFGALKTWEKALVKEFGKDSAWKIFKDLGKSASYSFMAEGNEEFATQIGQDFADYITGVNKEALKGTFQRALDAGIIGGFSGLGMTSPSAIGVASYRKTLVKQAEANKEKLLTLGEKANNSKLRQRDPESFQKFLGQAVNDQNIYIPAEVLDVYYQQAAPAIVESLGVTEQYNEAKTINGDIEIPLAVWITKMSGEKAFADLADDIKFMAGDVSKRDISEIESEISKEVNSETTPEDKAKEIAETEKIYNYFLNKQKQAGMPDNVDSKEWNRVIKENAKIASLVAQRTAKKRGISVDEYIRGVPVLEGNNLNRAIRDITSSGGLNISELKSYIDDMSIEYLKNKYPKLIQKEKKQTKIATYRDYIKEYGGLKWNALSNEQKEHIKENKLWHLLSKKKNAVSGETMGSGFDQIAEQLVSAGKLIANPDMNIEDQLLHLVLDNAESQVSEDYKTGDTVDIEDNRQVRLEDIASELGMKPEVLLSQLLGEEVDNESVNTQDDFVRDENGEILFQSGEPTEAFKKWFGDSKVVDENGKPLVVYHGTGTTIEEFKYEFTNQGNDQLGSGFYFTTDRDEAEGYTTATINNQEKLGGSDNPNVIEAYLSIKKPLSPDYEIKITEFAIRHLINESPVRDEALTNYGDVEFDGKEKVIRNVLEAYGVGKMEKQNLLRFLFSIANDFYPESDHIKLFNKKVKQLWGFDGIVESYGDKKHYVVFFPEQIKSVNNRGTFDPDNPNILFQDELLQGDNAPAFYSAVEKAVTDTKQEKATPDQWLAQIKKTPGVKEEEITWLGLDEFLRGKKSITKAELLEHIQANKVEIKEVVLGATGGYKSYEELPNEIKTIVDEYDDANPSITSEALKEFGYIADFDIDGSLISIAKEGANPTKYEEYSLPGGMYYKELLVTMPSRTELPYKLVGEQEETLKTFKNYKEAFEYLHHSLTPIQREGKGIMPVKSGEDFTSSHFSEPNILYHIRFNERIDTEGKKVLFIEEIQSDWHQKGRERGYKSKEQEAKLKELKTELDIARAEYEKLDFNKLKLSEVHNTPEAKRVMELEEQILKYSETVPDAPLKKSWQESAFRRIVRWASENNFDKVAWTTGEQQADRYSLSKVVDKIRWSQSWGNKVSVKLKGLKGVSNQDIEILVDKDSGIIGTMDLGSPSEWTGKHISDVLGKGVAEKILKEEKGEIDEKTKIGGEGMKGFYDNILVKYADKFAKKFNSKVEKTDILYESNPTIREHLRQKDPNFREKESVHSIAITPSMRETALSEGSPLFQRQGSPIGAFDPNLNVIKIFGGANHTTIMHEFAHFWLEDEYRYINSGKATEESLRDFEAVKKWLDIKDGEPLTRSQHEKFADGFLTYLGEGKAPNKSLRRTFENFRNWIIKLYKDVKNLNVVLNDEVRSYFDKLLIAEEEIEKREKVAGYDPIFRSAEEANMTPEEYQAYTESVELAKSEARNEYLKEIEKLEEYKGTIEYKDRVKEIRAEAEKEVDEQKLYAAINYLRRDVLDGEKADHNSKLSAKILKEEYAVVNAYVGKFVGMVSEEGTHPDIVAELFGYESGEDLVNDILQSPSRQEAIDAIVNAKLEDEVAPTEEDAQVAIHNDKRTDVLVKEHEFLEKKLKEKGLSKRTVHSANVRKVAENIISKHTVWEASNPIKYYRQETTAGRQAEFYKNKGDYAKASKAKFRQAVSHVLVRHSLDFRNYTEKSLRYLKKFDSVAVIKSVGQEYVEQIHTILENWDLRKSVPYSQAKERKSLMAFQELMKARGIPLEIPENLMNIKQSYKTLTMAEFKELVDTVKAIEHIGRNQGKLIAAQKKRTFEVVKEQILSKLIGDVKVRQNITPSKVDKAIKAAKTFFAEPKKAEFIVDMLDGFEGIEGPIYQAVFQPIVEAENQETLDKKEAAKKLTEIFNKHYTKAERKKFRTKRFKVLGHTENFTKENLLAIALNMGNEENIDRLLTGHKWNEAQLYSLLNMLDKKDWDFAQDIWDFFETFWPKDREAWKDVVGIVPPKVKASPIKTKFGVYKGGYYPIKYSKESGVTAFFRSEEDLAKTMSGPQYAKKKVKDSSMKARTGSSGEELDLTLDTIPAHLTEVIHRYTHLRAVRDINMILNDFEISHKLAEVGGMENLKQIKSWLNGVITDIYNPQQDSNMFIRGLSKLRTNATIVSMGWKVSTALVQPLGFFSTMELLGVRKTVEGILKFASRPDRWAEKAKFVREKSAFMAARTESVDRDVRDAFKTSFGEKSAIKGSFLMFVGAMDATVTIPSWLEAYDSYIEKNKDHLLDTMEDIEKRAISHADSIVRKSQGSGMAKDLASIQRGNELFKMFTMFYSYFSALYNLGYRRTMMVKQGKAPAHTIISSAMLLWLLPSICEYLLREGLGGDDDDEYLEELLSSVASYPFATLPVIRDFTNAAFSDYSYSITPLQASIESGVNLFKEGKKAFDEDKDVDMAKLLEKGTMAAGYAFGLPTRQVIITVDGFTRWLDEEDINLRDVFMRKKKD